jgi:hypothetical protein
MVPIVHANVLGALAVRVTFGLTPLHIVAVAALVPTGLGFTVTVILYGVPGHDPVTEVGVIKYCIEPAVLVLGLVNVWLIVEPEPALPPVMPPDIVPIVQVNVLGTEEVRAMLGPVPLQVDATDPLVTAGLG